MGVLFRLHVRQTSDCPICGAGDESILHSLFSCKHATAICECSEFGDILVDAPSMTLVDRFIWVAGRLTKDKLHLFSFLAWAAWCSRNKEISETSNVDAVRLAAGFVKLVEDYCTYNAKVCMHPSPVRVLSSIQWFPPPMGTVKVNVDAHIYDGTWLALGLLNGTEKVKFW